MEFYDHILQSNSKALAKSYKYALKKEKKLVNKTMIGLMMTMHYGDITHQKELSMLEEQMDKIDTCLAYIHKD